MTTPNARLTRELVRMACCAPSVHNTQPWRWRIVDDATIQLYADRSRQLAELDPHGRDLALSCGAALHYLGVAAEAFGVVEATTLMPDPDDEDFLATVRLRQGEIPDDSPELLAALENRTTDRRGFTDWEVPEGRVLQLAEAARLWGARVEAITRLRSREDLDRLADESRDVLLLRAGVADEQDSWTNRSGADGIPPLVAAPHLREGVQPRRERFNVTRKERRPGAVEHDVPGGSAAVPVVICTEQDDQRSWLQAGRALSALWVAATREGLSVTPDSTVVEDAEVRLQLQRLLPEVKGHLQVMVRVGWPETSRPALTPTPRRPLDDVLIAGAPS